MKKELLNGLGKYQLYAIAAKLGSLDYKGKNENQMRNYLNDNFSYKQIIKGRK